MPLDYSAISSEEQISVLREVALAALSNYNFTVTELTNINHEYNSTFSVLTETNGKYALRINVNSGRTPENIAAEVFFLKTLSNESSINVVTPVSNRSGEFRTSVYNENLNQTFDCLLFDWLEGEELGDEPTESQLETAGALMAQMHLAMNDVTLPKGAELTIYNDLFWGSADQLLISEEHFSSDEVIAIRTAKKLIESVIADLYASEKPRIIHADMHGWNLMWNKGELTVFDFDDCGIGLPIQDLAVSMYYLDTEAQRTALIRGYSTVSSLPKFTKLQMDTLLVHRRLQLLNYLYESKTPEHRAMIPGYFQETIRRIATLEETGL